MRYYELTYLASSEISEKISNFIREESGTIEKTTKPLKKEEKILDSLDFYLNPEKLENLEKKLKSEKQIIRYIILTKKILKKIPSQETFTKKRRPQGPINQRPGAEKVELEEIDKKIDEILKE